jgi:4-amino-4-deoxy-L-arabinose transferase-like glycosyltransferase
MIKNKVLIILLVILLIGGFLRIFQLHSLPPGLYPDEAMNANDAFDNPGQPFYPENNGREGLYMNLVYLSFKIFGANVFALRVVSAMIGTITILGLYLLTKELLTLLKNKQAEYIALFSSFLLATSFWHINFSRIGFRGVLLPFCFSFCFYFLFKGFRTKNILNFVFSGIFLGFGFYTYSAYRMGFLIFLAVFLIYFIKNLKEKELKKFFIHSSIFALSAVIIASPLILYFINNTEAFFGRLGQVSVFSQENPALAFIKSLGAHLIMFNIKGDFNWRHNLSGSPQLLLPVGILFIIGIIICFKKWFLAHKNKDFEKLLVYYLLFSWFLAMLLPGALTHEGLPHALRTIGVIPICYIFAGIGTIPIYNKIKKMGRKRTTAIILLSLIILFSWQFYKYFYQYGKNENIKGAFTERFVKMAEYLNTQPENINKYVIVNEDGTPIPWPNGLPTPAQTLMFIEKTKYQKTRAIYLKKEELNLIKNEKAIIIPMKPDQEIISQTTQMFNNFQIINLEQNNKAIIINY